MPLDPLEYLDGDSKAKRLIQVKKALQKIKDPHIANFKDLTTFMLPSMTDWDLRDERQNESGEGTEIYDSTAVQAAAIAADGMQGYTAPKSAPWLQVQVEIERLQNEPRVREFRQETERHLYAFLGRSNFYHVLAEAATPIIVLGTGTIRHVYDQLSRRMVYEAIHPKQLLISQNEYGRVNTHINEHFVPLGELMERYEDRLPEVIRQRAKRDPYKRELVLHYVMPRDRRNPSERNVMNMPIAGYYVLEKGGNDGPIMLEETGYLEGEYTTMRWSRNSDETWGRGWGHRVLPETLRVNQMARTKMIQAHMAAEPPAAYPAELEGVLDLDPGGMTPITDMNRLPRGIDLSGNYVIAREEVNDVRAQIQDGFMQGFWLILQQSFPQMSEGNRTATEVLEMQGEKAALLSTVVDRWFMELLTPLLQKTWRIGVRNGQLPPVPRILEDEGIDLIGLDFVGPLAQIQRRFHVFQGINNTLRQLLPIASVPGWEDVVDRVDPDELAIHIMNGGNFPQKAIRDNRTVDRMRAQRARAAAQQQQFQQTVELADVADKLPSLAQVAGAGASGGAGGLIGASG